MDSFDKKIKRLFEEVEDITPTGFSWEEMESGIKNKMNNRDSHKNKKGIFWFIFGITAILILFVSIILNKNFTNTIEKNKIEKHQKLSSSPLKSEQNLSNNQLTSETDTIASKDDYVKPNTSINTINKSSISKTTLLNKSVKFRNSLYPYSKTNNIKIKHNNYLLDKKSSYYANNTVKPLTKIKASLRPINIKQIKISGPKTARIFKANNRNKLNPHKRNTFLCLSSGINTLLGNHKNNQYADKYTNNLPGYYIDISMNYNNSYKWMKTIGYTYNNYISLFQFEKSDQVKKTFRNIVIIKNINSLNKRSTEISGDTTVLRDRYRNITYYNTHKTHTIYLGIAKSIALNNNLEFLLSSRLLYTFIIESDGVSINKNEELIYFNDKNKNIFNNNKLAVGLGATINYRLNSTFKIGSNLQIDKYINNLSKESQVRYSPISLNVGINLNYSF